MSAKTNKEKVVNHPAVTERAALLFKVVAFTGEATNLQNMLFMKRGDLYVEYVSTFPKTKVNYPTLRLAIEKDLGEAPTNTITRISTVNGVKKSKDITVYPWGEQSIKAKAHSLAVSMLKTWQRRMLKFGGASKLENVTLFSKYSKFGTPEASEENKTFDSITKKSIHKEFNEQQARDFLNSFLVPKPAVKAVKKAA